MKTHTIFYRNIQDTAVMVQMAKFIVTSFYIRNISNKNPNDVPQGSRKTKEKILMRQGVRNDKDGSWKLMDQRLNRF